MIDILKRLVVFEDVLHWENGALASPFRQVVACALFDNPWLGLAPDADLSAGIERIAPDLGKGLAEECVRRLGGADGVACIGKGSLVGLSGEIEHANVLIHTRLFGNEVRSASKGKLWMVGGAKRGGAGASLDVPVAHKSIDKHQGSYHSIEVRVSDGPQPGELLVAVAMTSGLRPRARPFVH